MKFTGARATAKTFHRKVEIDSPGPPSKLVYHNPDKASVVVPGVKNPTDAVVRVLASTCTYIDLMILSNNYFPKVSPFPIVPGYDAVGIVEALGNKVDNVKVGDMVVCLCKFGGCQQYLTIKATELYVVPDNLAQKVDALQLVCLPLTGVTAFQLLHRVGNSTIDSKHRLSHGKFRESTKILIHACSGGTGSMIVRLAILSGIPSENIYGTCSFKNKEYAKQIGVGNPIDYESLNEAGESVCWSTVCPPVDIVLDSIGGLYYAKSIKVLNSGGSYIGYGFTSKKKPGKMNMGAVFRQLLSMWGQSNFFCCLDGGKTAKFYTIAEFKAVHPQWYKDDLLTLIGLVHDSKLKVPIEQVVGLEDVAKALNAIAGMQHKGKIVVAVDQQLCNKEKEHMRLGLGAAPIPFI